MNLKGDSFLWEDKLANPMKTVAPELINPHAGSIVAYRTGLS